MSRLVFCGGNKVAAADIVAERAAILVEIQNDFDSLEAEPVAHQGFVGGVAAFIILAQIILQIQPGFDNLATAAAADINPIDPSRLGAA
ncbi:MAG: hypothetical protein HC875_02725 [Anaerolineales bacterium]|nr:hypothetical protein [Anaerolineales bacterium]